MGILIKNATIITGDQILENHSILLEKDKISKIAAGYIDVENVEEIDMNGDYVSPGFVDLQINGGAGAFFTKDLDTDSLIKMGKVHMEYGTTSFLPTLISTSHDRILDALKAVKEVQGTHGILGMHLEGPYFNVKKKGAHFEKFIHSPEKQEIDDLIREGEGVLKLITLAPEVVDLDLVRSLVDNGIKVSAGHSDASYNEAFEGFKAGISKVTHLFNAMSQFNSRNPGLVGAFFNSNAWGAIIADGIHVDYAAIKVAYNLAKGRLFLVSDASFVKHPIKEFEFDGFKIHYDGGNYYTDDNKLAGASISLYDAFKNCVEKLNIPLIDAVKMACTYPATYIGADHEIGYVKEGYKADLVLLDKALRIKEVIKDGQKMQFD